MKMRALAVTTIVALLAVVFLETAQAGSRVQLSPLGGAPNASGEVRFSFEGAVFTGKMKVKNLPPQAFGSGLFYGLWFVRTDTGAKAFLGAAINKKSIILFAGGRGELEFRATHFTDPLSPGVGTPITLGPAGSNLFILLIENKIDGKSPSPLPGPAGMAASGTF